MKGPSSNPNKKSQELSPTEIDLYTIIHPTKEAHFAKHGKHCQYGYEGRMEALKQGRPQQRLQEDKLARDIVRLLLARGEPTSMHGRDHDGWPGIEFPEILHDNLREKISDLMDDGLLEFTFQCPGPNYYAFAGEFITKPAPKMLAGTYTRSFHPHNELRNALRRFLRPFATEKRKYVLPPQEF